MRARTWKGAAAAAALLALWTGAAKAADELTLQLKWVTQAQFAGYFVAKDKGFYDEVGLDVTIKPGGPDINPSQVIAGGGADVVVDWMPSALATREKGVPLVNIAQVFQKSGMMLTCRNDSGVTSPEPAASPPAFTTSVSTDTTDLTCAAVTRGLPSSVLSAVPTAICQTACCAISSNFESSRACASLAGSSCAQLRTFSTTAAAAISSYPRRRLMPHRSWQ